MGTVRSAASFLTHLLLRLVFFDADVLRARRLDGHLCWGLGLLSYIAPTVFKAAREDASG